MGECSKNLSFFRVASWPAWRVGVRKMVIVACPLPCDYAKIAIENGSLTVDLRIENGDFP